MDLNNTETVENLRALKIEHILCWMDIVQEGELNLKSQDDSEGRSSICESEFCDVLEEH